MAMTTDKKLYIAVGALALVGAAVYFQKQAQQKEEATYTLEGQQATLPTIEWSEEKGKSVDTITVEQPAGDAGKPEKVVVKKVGEDDWKLVEPIDFPANSSTIQTILGSIDKLEVRELISKSKDSYGKYGLGDGEATHIVLAKGDEKLVELYVGEGGSRGNMVRIGDKEGVYAIKGYSSYMFQRDLKGWRDRKVLEIDPDEVAEVEIENDNGVFSFEKEQVEPKQADKGDKGADKKGAKEAKPEWAGKIKAKLSPVALPIAKFHGAKVDDMLRAFKSLTASEFGDDKTPKEVGLDEPTAKVTFTMADGGKRVLLVATTAENSNRWAQVKGKPQVFAISSYSSGWALADQDRFRKPEDKENKDAEPSEGAEPAAPAGMPPAGMQMPPMSPPGH